MTAASKDFPAATRTNPQRLTLWQGIKRDRWPYLFISPFFILFAVFGLYPLLFSVYLSFGDWKGRGPIDWIGTANYGRMLSDGLFWQSLANGFILFFMYVPLMLFLALILAVILNSKRIRGYRVFRTIIFLPFITNMVAGGFTFQILLAKTNGLFNLMLGAVGISPVPWLEDPWLARVSLCLLIMWAWLGYNMVLMLAGLQTIPADLTEAALVDGATPSQAFVRVTVPLMRPIILFCAITSLIGSFGLFAEVASLTRGGPVNATLTTSLRIYNVAFVNFQFGYASALAYTYFAIIFVVALVQMRLLRGDEG